MFKPDQLSSELDPKTSRENRESESQDIELGNIKKEAGDLGEKLSSKSLGERIFSEF